MKLSTQDKRDLERYTKFLALKSTQIIVQSRLGEKQSTQCRPEVKGTDWVSFNLGIHDTPDVLSETRRALNDEIISTYIPLCVEISLRTCDGDVMLLETWTLTLLPEPCDSSAKHNIYNRMGILLKSLLSVTRVTPAYKLSRRQGPDTYVICYRVCVEHPQVHYLGEGHKEVRIGQICTPIGTIQLSVAYRTKMTISPTQTEKNSSIMVKSDHFTNNNNLRKHRTNNDDISDLTKPMRPGPFADAKPKMDIGAQLPGVERLLALGKERPKSAVATAEPEIVELSSLTTSTGTKSDDESNNAVNNDASEGESAEKSSTVSTTTALATLASTVLNPGTTSLLKSVDHEYWMQELNAPFATRGPVGELMQFYKQCKTSPPLQSPQKNPSPEEITKLIEMYESQLPEYDALVESLSESIENM